MKRFAKLDKQITPSSTHADYHNQVSIPIQFDARDGPLTRLLLPRTLNAIAYPPRPHERAAGKFTQLIRKKVCIRSESSQRHVDDVIELTPRAHKLAAPRAAYVSTAPPPTRTRNSISLSLDLPRIKREKRRSRGWARLSSAQLPRNYGSCHGCSFVDGVFAPRGGCPNHEPRKLQRTLSYSSARASAGAAATPAPTPSPFPTASYVSLASLSLAARVLEVEGARARARAVLYLAPRAHPFSPKATTYCISPPSPAAELLWTYTCCDVYRARRIHRSFGSYFIYTCSCQVYVWVVFFWFLGSCHAFSLIAVGEGRVGFDLFGL